MFPEDDREEYAYAQRIESEAEKWRLNWPHHCKKCHGWGGSSYTEMHGFKGGSGEQMFDVCEALPNVETCHRCGEDGLNEEGEGPCKHCGWNYDDGEPRL